MRREPLPKEKPPERSFVRSIRWLLFGALFLCVGLYILIPAFLTFLSVHPSRAAIDVDPLTDYGLEYERVSFTTSDDLKLFGWYIPSQNGAAVIAVHEYGGNRTGMLPHAAFLARHGYGVLLFDLRAHGESQGDVFALGWDADRDIYAALDFLSEEAGIEPDRIGVLGISVGAEAGIEAAAGDKRIKALVAEGVSYRTVADIVATEDTITLSQVPGVWVMVNTARLLSGAEPPPATQVLIARIAPRALFLIAANVPEEQLPNQVYYRAAGEPKFLWEPTDTEYATALETYPEEYEEKVIDFFDEFLLEPGVE